MTDISLPAETSKIGGHLHPRNTFGEFVVGTGNQLAHAASIAAADQPGDMYNPLFIYGSVRLRKTHLAGAISHQLRNDREGLHKVIFLSSGHSTKAFIS